MCRTMICSLRVIFALLGVIGHSEGTRVYEMNLVNLTYGSLTDDVEFNMTINQEGLMTLNTVLHKSSSDYFNTVIVAFQDANGDYSNIFLNKTIDLCKFLSTPTYEPLVHLYYKQVLKHENNIPAACPLGGGAHYFVRNVEMSGMPIPPFVPSSNAYMEILFFIKESNGQFKHLSGGKIFIKFRKLTK